ncbi:DUF1796 family putative cysteine peptidase [Flavobacterium pectinovorum]|uniref:DUF1796 family putative cysteine peptidase n=1 Tax=Flavobacterium pectinovorum TaxID=29533 RepID=UPI001FABD9A3|nr:DUF1796 family putative cysteine peptidase [Flavobacterium pectinovorum]MCI9846581.1 hypothetical protein [Flavobacterium pectinovorum]
MKKIFKMFLPNRLFVLIRNYKNYKIKQEGRKQKEYEFDIIFSLGNSCRPAYYLRKHKLRIYANPLDWMMVYSLETVVNLYQSKFNDFFINFSEHKQKPNWFTDVKNNITSVHYPEIKYDNKTFNKRMKKRFNKVNQKLKKANKICFLSQRNEKQTNFIDFLTKIGNLYSAEITLINIKHNEEIDGIILPVKYSTKKISDQLKLIEYEFNDIHPNGNDCNTNSNFWIGNVNFWDEIVGKIHIKTKFIPYLLKKESL